MSATVGISREGFNLRRMVIFTLALVISLFSFSALPAKADDPVEAQKELQQYVAEKVAGESYRLEGGGSTTGTDLVKRTDEGLVEVDTVVFEQLEKGEQKRFVQDLDKNAQLAMDPKNPERAAKTASVTKETVTNWYKELQANPGVGAKLLSTMMSEINPDFVGANRFLSGFFPFLNIVLGIIGILTMSFLAFTILLDVAYITIPMFQTAIGDSAGSGGGEGVSGKVKSFFSVSKDAVNAVNSASEGGTAAALWAYLKTRSVGLFVLGAILVLLVAGYLFNMVGVFMDIVANFVS